MLKMLNLIILHVRVHVQLYNITQMLVGVNTLVTLYVPVDVHVLMLNLSNQ